MSLQEALAKNAELEKKLSEQTEAYNALKAQLDQLQKLIFGSKKKSALLRKKIHCNYHCLVMVRIRK